MTAAVIELDRLRPVSVTPPITETEMATNRKTKKTSVPGVYRRGSKYLYAYRANGRQRWGTADSIDDARRKKRQADADADRGELIDLSTVGFGEYARDWIETYQGRTSSGFRESTRRSYRQMIEARVIPYFDAERRLQLAQITPRDVKAFVRWIVAQHDPRRPGRLLSKSTIRQHASRTSRRPNRTASSQPRKTDATVTPSHVDWSSTARQRSAAWFSLIGWQTSAA